MASEPFTIAVPEAELDDLRMRLAQTRWPHAADASSWRYGISLAYMRELVEHWRSGYDWRRQEAELNRFAHYKATVEGVGLHFIHARGKGPDPTPLLLLHGFPDSFYRYHKVIERLTDPAKFGGDPARSFDVVVPSLPGTGFSDPVVMNYAATARLFAALMSDELGYGRFVAAGGDIGAMVIQSLALQRPELLRGIHLTDVGYPDETTDFATLSPAEGEMAQWVQRWFMEEGIGVNMIMATRPQTLAYGLTDSPVGLAAWLISYASGGLKGQDEFKTRFSADELLTNVMLYWLTGTITTAAETYYANMHVSAPDVLGPRTAVPAAVAHCPYDPPLPREWAERRVNLVHFTDFPRGGHFMAWEAPELYADDLQAFVGALRA